MLVSGHRRAVREPHLYRSRRARRDERRPRGERDLHRPVVRRTAEADRRAADRRDAQGRGLNGKRAGARDRAHAGTLG
ncbi:LigA [Burkholderia ambifaria]